MPQPTREEIAEFESKHRRIAVLRSTQTCSDGTPEWCVVLRRPSRPEYKRLRSASHDEGQKADAQEMTFRQICVWPSDVEALLEDWPGIPEACGQAMLDLVGAQGTRDAK